MKFKNKKTGKVIDTKDAVKIFSYTHNSLWEKVVEVEEPVVETEESKEEKKSTKKSTKEVLKDKTENE